MVMRSRSNTLKRRMASWLGVCGASLLVVTSAAGQDPTVDDVAALDRVPEAEVLPATLSEEPFQIAVVVTMAHTVTSASRSFAVPAGKRLVVENLSGRGASTGVQSVTVGQSPTLAVLPPKIINTGWKWIGTTPTKVRFNAGTVLVTIDRPSPSGTCSTCTSSNYVTITGYLIPQ
jgi:hypothetical protein